MLILFFYIDFPKCLEICGSGGDRGMCGLNEHIDSSSFCRGGKLSLPVGQSGVLQARFCK